MNHKQKVKLARKMMTPKERLFGVSVFNTAQWRIRYIMRRAKEILRSKNSTEEAIEHSRKVLGVGVKNS